MWTTLLACYCRHESGYRLKVVILTSNLRSVAEHNQLESGRNKPCNRIYASSVSYKQSHETHSSIEFIHDDEP